MILNKTATRPMVQNLAYLRKEVKKLKSDGRITIRLPRLKLRLKSNAAMGILRRKRVACPKSVFTVFKKCGYRKG